MSIDNLWGIFRLLFTAEMGVYLLFYLLIVGFAWALIDLLLVEAVED